MKEETTYLLKRWKETTEDDWHFSLKDIQTGEIRFFHSLVTLSAFLNMSPKNTTPTSNDY